MNEYYMHLQRIDDAVDQLENIFRSGSEVAEYIVLTPDSSNIPPVEYLPFVGFTVPALDDNGRISSVDIYYIKKDRDGRWVIRELCPLDEESLHKYRRFMMNEDYYEYNRNHLVSGYLLGTYDEDRLIGCSGQVMVFSGGFNRGIHYYNGTLDRGMDFDKCY